MSALSRHQVEEISPQTTFELRGHERGLIIRSQCAFFMMFFVLLQLIFVSMLLLLIPPRVV